MDKEIFETINQEAKRQDTHIDLIASENITYPAVREAQGSILTNKYAEGLPGKRYYGGCEQVDQIERLAISRATQLFGCRFANVQPHSGSSANLAVFFSFLRPGDTFMALSLNEGGHLTHGAPVNFSGKWFRPVAYGVDPKTQKIDMEKVRQKALNEKPKLIIAGLTAYTRPLDFQAFRQISDEVGAILLVDMAHIAGLVATGLHSSPFPHAHVVTSTTHKTLRGPRGGIILWDEERLTKKLNMAVFPGLQGGPLMHVIAGKAVAFGQALRPEFKTYMHQVCQNASAMAAALSDRGFTLLTGGTSNHMLLIDLRPQEISGKRAEEILEVCGIICNKNTVPEDPRSPMETSGIRIGTPAVTTCGAQVKHCIEIAHLIADVLDAASKGDVTASCLQAFKERAHAAKQSLL